MVNHNRAVLKSMIRMAAAGDFFLKRGLSLFKFVMSDMYPDTFPGNGMKKIVISILKRKVQRVKKVIYLNYRQLYSLELPC